MRQSVSSPQRSSDEAALDGPAISEVSSESFREPAAAPPTSQTLLDAAPATSVTELADPGPIDIEFMDTTSLAEWLGSLLVIGEVSTDIGEVRRAYSEARVVRPQEPLDGRFVPRFIVDKVLAKAKGRKIRRLTFRTHGEPGKQRLVGEVDLEADHFDRLFSARNTFQAELDRLTPHLTEDALIVLGGCEVALGDVGETLLKQAAAFFGRPVQGSTSMTIGTGWNPFTGATVTCLPSGTCVSK